MPEQLRARAERAIRERVFPGCIVGILKRGEASILPFGTLAGAEAVVQENTVYDLASVTKSIPLAALIADLIGEGSMSLSDTVVRYVPELQNDFGATIEDLLRYRVQGDRLSRLANLTPQSFVDHILTRGFSGPPGNSAYSNLPALLLGMIVERITSTEISALAQQRYFGPLGMSHTSFFPDGEEAFAPTETDASGADITGVPHDASARIFAMQGKAVGHAGLFSTVGDLLLFLRHLLEGESLIAEMAEQGLGWSVGERYFMGDARGERTFGKTGFTGTSVLCDREKGVGLVILSNRTYPKRPDDAFSETSAMNQFRCDIATIVLSDS